MNQVWIIFSALFVLVCAINDQHEWATKCRKNLPGKPFLLRDGSCFTLSTRRVSAFDASKDCTKHGGLLAMLKDKATADAVMKTLNVPETRESVGGAKANVWIGLVFDEHEERYMWRDDEYMTYNNINNDTNSAYQDVIKNKKRCTSIFMETGQWIVGRCKTYEKSVVSFFMPLKATYHHDNAYICQFESI